MRVPGSQVQITYGSLNTESSVTGATDVCSTIIQQFCVEKIKSNGRACGGEVHTWF